VKSAADRELGEQVALVTGGAQGLGLGIAVEMARAGSRVVIGDLNLRKAEASAEEIRAMVRQEIIARSLDVTDEQSVAECVRSVIDHFGRIDVLINNAAIHPEGPARPATLDDLNRCLDVNLVGVWRMTAAVVPHFKAQRSGKIVNIASVNGRQPWAHAPAYSASKAALINLTRSLAMSLGEDNINVNAVCPGGVLTAMAEDLVRDSKLMARRGLLPRSLEFLTDLSTLRDEMMRSRPLRRLLSPEDIGHAVVFLASPRSRNVTGQCLNVDGGELMS
jgi:NAD(P)-dependent dehydrogenase (short-subunit alcohol dehydrogenase family)